MRIIKQFLITAGMLIVGSAAIGQTGSGILPTPVFHWRCSAGNATLNHNPAMHVASSAGACGEDPSMGSGAIVFDSVPYAKDYTMILVYRPVSSVETALWQMTFGDSVMRGLTTERILSDSISIRYTEQTDVTPAINTLRQSSPDSTMPYVRLAVGGDGDLNVAEVLYYAERLGNAALRRVQSLLAVRYGITLGPVSYLDGAGHHIWDYADSGLYHHRVTGVGIDTLTGLRQLRSRSEMGEAVLTIATDSMEHGAFLMVGDNDAPLAFEQDGSMEILGRNWRIQSTNMEGRRFSLAFDTRDLAMPGDSLALLVGCCGVGSTDSYIYLPDCVGGDSAVFSGVEFPTDSSLFTLGRGGVFWQLARLNGARRAKRSGADDAAGAESRFATRIYPNPTSGHYALDVEGAGQVQVTIHNVQGAVVATYTSEGRGWHRFEGDLPSGNVYYATVSTENGSQTMKLVVK